MNWTTQLRKGALELAVLHALNGDRLYGYDIVKRLGAVGGLVMGEGTVYPILSRFRRDGLVEATLEESPEGRSRVCRGQCSRRCCRGSRRRLPGCNTRQHTAL